MWVVSRSVVRSPLNKGYSLTNFLIKIHIIGELIINKYII